MADGLKYHFGAQRNEDYLRVWQWTDIDDNPLDISGWIFAFRINTSAGLSGSPLLEVGMTPVGFGSILTITEAANGELQVFLKKEDTADLPGRTSDVIPFAYNLIATDGAGIRRADVRGAFIVEPGV